MKRGIIALFLILLTTAAPSHATEQSPIKIGFVYSYTLLPNPTELALKGAQLALKEFNDMGGLNGRKAEFLVRDDHGNAADGVRIAHELVDGEKVDVLTGMSAAHVAKGIYEYTERQKIPYFSTWCSSDVCAKKNGYTFSFEEPYAESAQILAWQAAGYPIKKWAIVRNADEWSVSVSKPFFDELKRLRPDVELVTEIVVPYGKAQGNVIAQTLKTKGAQGVYVTMVGGDLTNYVRAQNQRGEMDDYRHIHAYLTPEELNVLGKDLPKNWYILSYPQDELKTQDNLAFIKKFRDVYHKDPGLSGLLSYAATQFMLGSLKKAGSTNADAVAKAAETITVQTPVGPMSMTKDNVADFTYWYGTTDIKNGKPVLTDFKRGKDIHPPKGQ